MLTRLEQPGALCCDHALDRDNDVQISAAHSSYLL
jgi:hypothetical protein